MKRVFTIVLGITVLLSGTAFAQPTEPEQPKSAATASYYSHLGTLIPVIVGGVLIDDKASNTRNNVGLTLFTLGLVVGPGLGHLYADNQQFGKGLFVRGAACAAIVYGVAHIDIDIFDEDDDNDNGAGSLILLGAVVLAYSMVHDIKSADRSAREFNARYKLSQVEFQPYLDGRSNSIGLAFTFRY